jgi:16S rRNA processing protein RimM
MRAGEMTDVFIGRVVKAVGIRGELKLDPSADFWEGVLRSRNLVLLVETEAGIEQRTFVVERFRPHKTGYVVGIRGVTDRNHAEALVGGDVVIDPSGIDVELPSGKLPFQVLGSRVLSAEGKVLGVVTSILHSPAHDLYEVTGEKGTFMVPAVSEFVKSIDDRKRELVIETIPGLIDEETDE